MYLKKDTDQIDQDSIQSAVSPPIKRQKVIHLHPTQTLEDILGTKIPVREENTIINGKNTFVGYADNREFYTNFVYANDEQITKLQNQ